MLCCSGPPLPEAPKLLAPLANIEELSLGGNNLGGTITADMAVFKKLKKLDLSRMGLDSKPLSIRTEWLRVLTVLCLRRPFAKGASNFA